MRVNRPGLGEAVASAICLALVLVALVAVDGRVRDRFGALVSQASSQGVAPWGERASAFGDAVLQSVRDRSIDKAPLLVFTGIGAGLLFFMLRT